jgi:hypothetical protein
MNTLFAAITLPTQVGDILSFVIMTVIAFCTITAMGKVIQAWKHWVHGDDAFAEFKSAFLIAGVPWLIQAAFNGVGLYSRLGIPLVPSAATGLPTEVIDLIQYGLWILCASSLLIGIFIGVEGVQKSNRGEEGMRQMFGGVGMAASPYLMIAAFKIGGYWTALGLRFI